MSAREFTAAQLADCAEREAKMRRRVYPRWVEAGRMKSAEADRQIAMMQEIADRLHAEGCKEADKDDLFGGGQ